MREKISGSCSRTQENFRQREVGQRGVAGELDDMFAAEGGVQPVTLGAATGITPDERGTQDLTVGVEQDGAVHLACQPDGSNVGGKTLRGG